MRIGKLCLAAFLGAIPAVAVAQPSIDVRVGVDAEDSYDSDAPGDPVESVDVFYDQLSPYGAWVDEPDVGLVFIPAAANYVPYYNGHWQYTSVGFVWISSEPHAWATSHYGRWAYSNNYGRWYWLPDTEWGPAWVEWRQTGSDFGWAPLAPDVVVRNGWSPPVESWHYAPSNRILDVNVTRYYEPRARVVEIHREARPIEHYSTVSRVKVNVGPPVATLRERHVEVRPVRLEARTVGRWSPAEAHAQVAHAQDHRATFEVQNQRRIESDAHLRAAHVKVIETHPQVREQVNLRVQGGARVEPARSEPHHVSPGRIEPNRIEPNRVEPNRVEPHRPAEPVHVAPGREPRPVEPTRVAPNHGEPNRVEPSRAEPVRPAEPARPPQRVEPARPQAPQHMEPARPAPQPPQRVEPARPQPPQQHEQPHPAAPPAHAEPAHPAAPPAGNDEHKHDHH